jgi:hypothetical protein
MVRETEGSRRPSFCSRSLQKGHNPFRATASQMNAIHAKLVINNIVPVVADTAQKHSNQSMFFMATPPHSHFSHNGAKDGPCPYRM